MTNESGGLADMKHSFAVSLRVFLSDMHFKYLAQTLKSFLVPDVIEQELGINDFLQSRQRKRCIPSLRFPFLTTREPSQ